jgi:pyruvate formate lyase activating enzyme
MNTVHEAKFYGSFPGAGGENTYCYRCGALLIERYGFFVRANRIRAGRCPECETAIDGIGLSPDEHRPEARER